MDKRTLLSLFLLCTILFLVNIYFQRENDASVKLWQEQQFSQQITKEQELQKKIAQKTASLEQLPIVSLFREKEGGNFLSYGVETKNAILAFPWSNDLPTKVYAKGESGSLIEYTLSYRPEELNPVALYQTEQATPLRVGSLPDFGSFDLQLVTPTLNPDQPPLITFGQYQNGQLLLLTEQLHHLVGEIKEKKSNWVEPELPKLPELKSFVLIKTEKEYLPVGYYQPEEHLLIDLEEISDLTPYISKAKEAQVVTSSKKPQEKFFVLESPYQQLVFSNYGGALVEINLPFKSDQDSLSVVKEIEFDREMEEKHPYNAHFPSHAYYTSQKEGDGSYQEHSKGELGGYYPLIRRDLIESTGGKAQRISPKYYALNIVSEYPEVAELVYEVKFFDQEKIVFEVIQGHRRITKTYSLAKKDGLVPYCFDLDIQIQGDNRGLWLTSGVPEVEWISGAPAPALKYRMKRNQKAEIVSLDIPKDAITNSSIFPDWICNSNGFLGLIIDPLSSLDPGLKVQMVPGNVVPSRLLEIDRKYERFKAQNLPGYLMMLPLSQSGGSAQLRIFAGPFASSTLKAVDKTFADPSTGYNPDYIASQSFHGWFTFISEPFAAFLFILMQFFYKVTHSWAFSIVLLTVALRLMLYPLNAWSAKSMARMQKVSPLVVEIQNKYKKDPKKAQLEIMNLYREHKVNPVSGCLPMLIQMPFLIGMFDLLKSTFELRGASFIPGWIDNLTSPDVLFSWSTPIFFIGTQFHLLPILIGAVMYLQQRFMSNLPADPKTWTDQQRQQRTMGMMMTVVFMVMFYNFPSGLNIYWLSSILLGALQQWWTNKQMQAQTEVPNKVKVQGK